MEQTLAAPLPQVVPTHLPNAAALGRASMGFLLLGSVAALGAAPTAGGLGLAPTALITEGGALLLTGPALLVAHQFLGLEARVTELVAALSNTFCRSGDIALGLTPALLFFSATTGRGPGLLFLGVSGIGVFALSDAVTGLVHAETQVRGNKLSVRRAKMQSLALGWFLLTGLIGLRIALRMGGVA